MFDGAVERASTGLAQRSSRRSFLGLLLDEIGNRRDGPVYLFVEAAVLRILTPQPRGGYQENQIPSTSFIVYRPAGLPARNLPAASAPRA